VAEALRGADAVAFAAGAGPGSGSERKQTMDYGGAVKLSSVADGRGELHDVTGVWIGDASAFPTAPGVNPMISIMALAHRTAGELLAAG
jgi:GMC oxidoreductase